jgi:hypothetical protein
MRRPRRGRRPVRRPRTSRSSTSVPDPRSRCTTSPRRHPTAATATLRPLPLRHRPRHRRLLFQLHLRHLRPISHLLPRHRHTRRSSSPRHPCLGRRRSSSPRHPCLGWRRRRSGVHGRSVSLRNSARRTANNNRCCGRRRPPFCRKHSRCVLLSSSSSNSRRTATTSHLVVPGQRRQLPLAQPQRLLRGLRIGSKSQQRSSASTSKYCGTLVFASAYWKQFKLNV